MAVNISLEIRSMSKLSDSHVRIKTVRKLTLMCFLKNGFIQYIVIMLVKQQHFSFCFSISFSSYVASFHFSKFSVNNKELSGFTDIYFWNKYVGIMLHLLAFLTKRK